MTLVGVLAAILFERLLGRSRRWGRSSVLPAILGLAPRVIPWPPLWRHPIVLLFWWAMPVTTVYYLMADIPDPILQTLIATLILLLCLGPRDLAEDIQRLLAARDQRDTETEQRLITALRIGVPQPDASHRSLLGSLFIQSHERLFGVLLGFLLLGPAGAVAYRIARHLPSVLHDLQGDSAAQRRADQLHQVLAWAPARITALLFGLSGSLDDALSAWQRLRRTPTPAFEQTWAVLSEVSVAAVLREEADGAQSLPGRLDDCLNEVVRMQSRALLILLAIFAVATTRVML